ncbi:MAG TPA: enoyl-CoA hydratase-related protein [Steroidobacteraceae bacterium]|jgi:enoyl-CoA hydratase/carnithine racemase
MNAIEVSASGGVCEIRLNRPEKRNAVTLEMYSALVAALQRAQTDDCVRVVLLSGAGASFTAGNDLGDFVNGPPLSHTHPAAQFVRLLPSLEKVMIAAVHGTTVGVGVTLLLHCDFVLAARETRLAVPFVQLGLVPEAGSSLLLPRVMGYQRAAEMLLLGRPIDANQALQAGLVSRIVEDEQLLNEARALAQEVAKQPPHALLATRRLLRSPTSDVRERIEEELRAFQTQRESAEFRQAAQDFFDRNAVR